MEKTILIYHFSGEEESALLTLAARKGIRVIPVPPALYERRLSELPAASSAPAAGGGEAFAARMMVFRGFEEGEFDLLLELLRRNKIGLGSLKAVMTPTNARWTSRELYRELEREREAFFKLRTSRLPGK